MVELNDLVVAEVVAAGSEGGGGLRQALSLVMNSLDSWRIETPKFKIFPMSVNMSLQNSYQIFFKYLIFI